MLTHKKLDSLDVGEWASDGGPRGGGVLVARKLQSGHVIFYFRYTDPTSKRSVLTLGTWDKKGQDLSLAAARQLADRWSVLYRSGVRDLQAFKEQEEGERQRAQDARRREEEAAAALASATLGALLSAYVAQLRADGKSSAPSVERSIDNHVKKAWPKLWVTPAAEVEQQDLLAVLAKVTAADKLRQAAKLRSYLKAAYNAAIRSQQDARSLQALRDLKIFQNPATNLVAIDGASGVRDRALSVAELQAYWRRICAIDETSGALLRFHLLTGGQRVEQLGRLTMSSFERDRGVITLLDKKGRRRVARKHDVPLVRRAVEDISVMNRGLGEYVFSVTAGRSGASYRSLEDRIKKVCQAMEEAGELEKGAFTAGDLRRTVETRLAALGFQPSELAQLQSHGLGGVQARHYNRYDYLTEKRKALEALYELASGTAQRHSRQSVPLAEPAECA